MNIYAKTKFCKTAIVLSLEKKKPTFSIVVRKIYINSLKEKNFLVC